MLRSLNKRELQGHARYLNSSATTFLSRKIPPLLKERELDTSEYNKIFASAWLNSSSFVLGTKCNKLIRWDIGTNTKIEIPLAESLIQPSTPPESCGIHCIAVNPSGTLLVTGASNPDDAAVLQLPSFEPLCILTGHKDWVFGAAWITDTLLATGSRDSSVKVWDVNSDSFVNSPSFSKSFGSDKVRDVKYCQEAEMLVSLGHNFTCNLWDPYVMEVVSSIPCPEKKELVCLAVQQPLVAIGSQSLISFIDMRCGHGTKSVASADSTWGVRSLSFCGDILTCGGGRGGLSFLDLRTQRYMDLGFDEELPGKHSEDKKILHRTGKGHLVENAVFLQHFSNEEVSHAAYTHCYDPTGSMLLVAGGPLAYGLHGSYAALW